MKTIQTLLWLAAIVAAAGTVSAQTNIALANTPPPPAPLVAETNAPPPSAVVATADMTAAATAAATSAAPGETNAAVATPPIVVMPDTNAPSAALKPGELRLNFRGAPLETVLNYLSDAAGFIIVLDTTVRGKVDVWSSQPVTKDEAVNLLNTVLNKNGYAVIRDDRTLTIVDKSEAKLRDIPVKVSNDPDAIPKNDEVVTQIIPVRFIEAEQLVKDLSSFMSPQATVVANAAANSIVVTDTQANIRHLVRIIRAIDNSAEGETQIRVFPLRYANPNDVATLLSGIFPTSTSGSSAQSPIRFGGPGGGFAQFFGGGGGRGGGGRGGGGGDTGTQNQRIQKQTQVIAVADLRTSSVVVTASKDMMEQIAVMIAQLDVNSTRDQNVYVFQMKNGDPQQAAQVLQNMFQSSTSTRSSSSSQNSALMQRQQNNASSSSATVSGSSSSSFGTSSGGRTGTGSGQLF